MLYHLRLKQCYNMIINYSLLEKIKVSLLLDNSYKGIWLFLSYWLWRGSIEGNRKELVDLCCGSLTKFICIVVAQ